MLGRPCVFGGDLGRGAEREHSWDSVDGAGDRGSLNPKMVPPQTIQEVRTGLALSQVWGTATQRKHFLPSREAGS